MTEEGNPGNWRGVARVVARLHTPLLDEGVRLVDTPGVGSVHEHNTLATDAYLPSLDAAVLVVSADPPISKAERAFLERVVEHAVRLFVVLNKADYLAPGELERIVAFTERVVQEVAPDWPGPVYTLSARTDVGDPAALRRFRHDLERFLRGDRAAAVVAYRRAAEPITDRAVSRVEQLQAEAAGAFGVPLPAFIAPELDLEVPQSVRGGGHAVAGHGVCDGGLMIDLSLMSRSCCGSCAVGAATSGSPPPWSTGSIRWGRWYWEGRSSGGWTTRRGCCGSCATSRPRRPTSWGSPWR